jgi:hypothetical protein
MLKLTLLAAAVLVATALAGCPERGSKPKVPATRPDGSPISERVRENTGLPVRLVLPEGAHGEEFDMLPPSLGHQRVTWQTVFHYDAGFPVLVADFDAQLREQGYSRLSGPTLDFDVNFTAESSKPSRAQGKKTWISQDQRIIVFLNFDFTRASEGQPEKNNYALSVLKTEEPYEVKPPDKVLPIPQG